jgi:hypothetical protein
MTALFSAALGAMLGFFGSFSIWWLERLRQRRIARMQVAINLRRWLQRALYRMSDVQTWVESGGTGGTLHTTLQNFRFERSLEQVALLDHRTAARLFKLIRKKDGANSEIEAEIEYGDDDVAVDLWRGRCARVWLRALELYEHISARIGWRERAFSDENKAMMQEEVDRLAEFERERARSQANLLKELSN